MDNILLATELGEQTLLGIPEVPTSGKPNQIGNCFSLEGGSGDKRWSRRIVNFYLENFRYVTNHGVLWPIKILPLSERVAIIFDERIPAEWYNNRYCETCCPESLLPHPQVMAHRLQEVRGERTTSKGDGQVRFGVKSFDVTRIDPNKRAKLDGDEKC